MHNLKIGERWFFRILLLILSFITCSVILLFFSWMLYDNLYYKDSRSICFIENLSYTNTSIHWYVKILKTMVKRDKLILGNIVMNKLNQTQIDELIQTYQIGEYYPCYHYKYFHKNDATWTREKNKNHT